jgi:hypothetical protein
MDKRRVQGNTTSAFVLSPPASTTGRGGRETAPRPMEAALRLLIKKGYREDLVP